MAISRKCAASAYHYGYKIFSGYLLVAASVMDVTLSAKMLTLIQVQSWMSDAYSRLTVHPRCLDLMPRAKFNLSPKCL